jgi:hypothetical protein
MLRRFMMYRLGVSSLPQSAWLNISAPGPHRIALAVTLLTSHDALTRACPAEYSLVYFFHFNGCAQRPERNAWRHRAHPALLCLEPRCLEPEHAQRVTGVLGRRLSFHLSVAFASHLLGYNMSWGITSKARLSPLPGQPRPASPAPATYPGASCWRTCWRARLAALPTTGTMRACG